MPSPFDCRIPRHLYHRLHSLLSSLPPGWLTCHRIYLLFLRRRPHPRLRPRLKHSRLPHPTMVPSAIGGAAALGYGETEAVKTDPRARRQGGQTHRPDRGDARAARAPAQGIIMPHVITVSYATIMSGYEANKTHEDGVPSLHTWLWPSRPAPALADACCARRPTACPSPSVWQAALPASLGRAVSWRACCYGFLP